MRATVLPVLALFAAASAAVGVTTVSGATVSADSAVGRAPVGALEELAGRAMARGDQHHAARLLATAAGRAEERGDLQTASRLQAAAEATAASSGDPAVDTWLTRKEISGQSAMALDRESRDARTRALGFHRHLTAESPALAALLLSIGRGALDYADLALAEASFVRSLAIQNRLAPGGGNAAATLNNLGVTALFHGDLEAAEDYFSRAYRIHQSRQPDGLSVAQTLGNLGLVAFNRGDLPAAEDDFRRALAIKRRLTPGSLEVAPCLRNLGLVAYTRGDLTAASDYFLRVVNIMERHAPGTIRLANSLSNLAMVARSRGDLALAESWFGRALAIQQEQAPDRLAVAITLGNLGQLALDRGDLIGAQAHFESVLAIHEQQAPASMELGQTLDNLGRVAAGNGNWTLADKRYREAFEIRHRRAPGSLAIASSLANLGAAARQRRALDEAELLYRQSLDIRHALAPGSVDEATSLHDVGLVLRDLGRTQEALDFLALAVAALEAQEGRLGAGDEGRSVFRARHLELFHDYLHLLLEAGRHDEAFHALERSRAQSLLAMLAERDLIFTADISPALDRQRRLAAAEADHILSELAGLSFAEPAQGERGVGGLTPSRNEVRREELLAALRAVRLRQDEIRSRIRTASPRLAALTSPQPLDLEATLAMLEPGTLLLAYSLAEGGCHLFAIEAGRRDLEVYALERGEPWLRAQVSMLRHLVRRPGGASDRLQDVGGELGEILLAPAASAICRAERLVIVPDGPLNLLPFAALSAPGEDQGERFLVQTAPLSLVASATVLAELKRARRPGQRDKVVAFADPLYPPTGADGPLLPGWTARTGLRLPPLPGSRREVESLRGLYGTATQAWLGSDATEERVKSIDRDVSIVHLAAHALVNEHLPLESALVLTIPDSLEADRDNGLLQVWEVFEEVRLDAHLVTLSACETALGREVTGEGIVGLTRAFQYAGARSVLASLWSVNDISTAELMERFYRHLEAGTSKDQSLRAAQLELLAGPAELTDEHRQSATRDASHPYHWAAFQLLGDWR